MPMGWGRIGSRHAVPPPLPCGMEPKSDPIWIFMVCHPPQTAQAFFLKGRSYHGSKFNRLSFLLGGS